MKEVARETVFANPWYSISRRDVVDPSGGAHQYFVVDKGDFVAAVAFDGERVALVDLFRVPINARSLELPEGGVDDGEDPAHAAVRELGEETGLVAESVQYIGSFYECNGLTGSQCHVYVATGLSQGPTARDAFEASMTVEWFTPEEIDALIGKRVLDGPSISAWTLARPHLR